MRIYKLIVATTVFALLGSCASAQPAALRFDGSSDAAAEASWTRMVNGAPAAQRQKLLIAMLKLNLDGVDSAYQVVGNPEFDELGIARIKDKIDGMTANEIIALAERVPVKAEIANP